MDLIKKLGAAEFQELLARNYITKRGRSKIEGVSGIFI